MRDLGGLRGACGRQLAYGRIFRCGTLGDLTEADFKRLCGLGIGLVCDLRSLAEREGHPTPWPLHWTPETLIMDVNSDLRSGRVDIIEALRQNPTEHGAEAVMRHMYREMPGVLLPHLQTLTGRLVQRPDTPVIIHCTAGKDRTGVFCALLLLALGVSSSLVMDDYLESAVSCTSEPFTAMIGRTIAKALGSPPGVEVVRAVASVKASYLEATLDAITEKYGSLELYLLLVGRGRQGLTRLQGALLTA